MRRFLHLIRGPAPDILRNDRRTRATRFLQFLCLAMTPDHTQAKEAVTWAETCLRDWRRHEAEQDWPALDATGKSRFILSLIEKVIDDLAPHDDAPWHLGFSSGLDSRLLHHVLRRKGVAFQPYTYGQPGNLDFDFSKLAEVHLGMTTLFFDTTTLDWSTERVDRMTAQVRDRPTSPARCVPRNFVGAADDRSWTFTAFSTGTSPGRCSLGRGRPRIGHRSSGMKSKPMTSSAFKPSFAPTFPAVSSRKLRSPTSSRWIGNSALRTANGNASARETFTASPTCALTRIHDGSVSG